MIQRIVSLCLLGMSAIAFAGEVRPSDTRSMPPYVVSAAKSTVPQVAFAVVGAVASKRIDALAPDPAFYDASSTQDKQKRMQIGWPYRFSTDEGTISGTDLNWIPLPGGQYVAYLAVSSPGASSFRVKVRAFSAETKVNFGAHDGSQVSRINLPNADSAWSDPIDGMQGIVELHASEAVVGSTDRIVQIEAVSSRPFMTANASFLEVQKTLRCPAGTLSNGRVCVPAVSGSCNIDLACVSSPSSALLAAARSVVRLAMVDQSNDIEYYCTGTLVNSESHDNYLYSAAHCISSQAEAASIIATYFAELPSCGSTATPAYQAVGGGGTLLVVDKTLDVSLVRLSLAPPVGATLSAWNATVVPTGTTVIDLHHPSGDWKKFSQGNMQGYAQGPQAYGGTPRTQANKDSFITVRWTNGTTEGGSSGSGVFTYNASGAYYELRGGLEGGAAFCDNLSGIDRFSRMDLLFTRLAPYLAPAAIIPTTTSAQASMVEYFNPQFNFYFISSRESEKTVLDSITDSLSNPLWYRTGYWFKTDPASSSQTSSITRYFIPGAAKNGTRGTHFYTALNSDRALITSTGKERFSSGCAGVPNTYFCNEGIDSYVAAPIGTGSSASCLSSEQPIYRAFRGATDDGNHRYLVNSSMYSYMVSDQGWAGEGVAFCAKP